ncbi:unnamed protein product [Caenorhabditis brenneri]
MKFQLVFLLAALIGSSHAQGLPGIICGITGLLCPPTTVAPTTTTTTVPTTTTASDTEEICFTVPGNNISIVINPTQLSQTEIDQIKQLLENSLFDVLGSLGVSIDGTLSDLVDGLTGILNPAATPAPTGHHRSINRFLRLYKWARGCYYNCRRTQLIRQGNYCVPF